jgi:pyruvate carboxylase subunit B
MCAPPRGAPAGAVMSAMPGPPFVPVKVTDLTMRDGHQSLFATRVRTDDLVAIAPEMDRAGFWSLEVWGGATFDVMTRFLNEDPWERIRQLKARMPYSRLQMLLRGQNLVGYRNYADDVVRAFVHHAADCGIDVFRVFDAVNDERNFVTAFQAIHEKGRHIQGALSYSVTEHTLGGPVYTLDYFVDKARLIEEMGADSFCIKDMAGLLTPADAYALVRALKQALKIPVWVHSHFTSGMSYMTLLKAVEAGVDGIDTCLAPFANRTSHSAIEPIVAALGGHPRAPELKLPQLLKLDAHFESIAPKYREFLDDTKVSVIDTAVLTHQIPGGMFSNMVAQLKQADAIDRLGEVYEELPRTREELGYPPLVTPTSQIVGTQAVLNVLFGRYKMVSKEVKDYCYGLYGKPPAPLDPEVQKLVLVGYERGEVPITCRAADTLDPELERAKEATKGLARDIGDILTYALYPTTGLRFLKWKYGVETPPPETKPKTLEEVRREEERVAKARKGELIDASEVPRVFAVKVGEETFEVQVNPPGQLPRPADAATAAPAVPPSAASAPPVPASEAAAPAATERSAVTAPMPGLILKYLVEVGAHVSEGDPAVVVEAMKMQNTLPARSSGTVSRIGFKAGDHVNRGEVLLTIE